MDIVGLFECCWNGEVHDVCLIFEKVKKYLATPLGTRGRPKHNIKPGEGLGAYPE